MDNVKAIVLDIDGVIVGEKIGYNSPHPNNAVMERMTEISNSGVKIILCTAKPHFAVGQIISGANLDNPHITDGGAVLINPVSNEIIKQHVADKIETEKLLQMCLDNNVYVEIYTTEYYIIQKSQVCDITDKHTHILQCEPKIVKDLIATAKIENVTKIMPVVNGEREKANFIKLFQELKNTLNLAWGIHPIALPYLFGVITASGISKNQGMLDILTSIGVSKENTLAVGDSTSDWGYMQNCKYVATMKNASQELKELVATKGKDNFVIGGHVDENGVLAIFDQVNKK